MLNSIIYSALVGDVLEVQDNAEALYRQAEKHLDGETSTLIRQAYETLFEARVRIEELAR